MAALMMQLSTTRHFSSPSPSPWPICGTRFVAVRCSSSNNNAASAASSSGGGASGSGDSSLDKKSWFKDDKNKLGRSVGWFLDRVLHKSGSGVMRDIKGLWDVCDSCGNMLYTRSEDDLNKRICGDCGHHLRRSSTDRVELLIDAGTWEPLDENMIARDALKFKDEEEYASRLVTARRRAGLTDAVQTGLGQINGIPVALGVMDFRFMGGSMGSVVGEKLTRLVEHATKLGLPLIIVCSSGGARMQEGTLSLMQMAKVSAALQVHQVQNGLLYIPILTNPTTGGITASFGMLGDLILAEPKAYIAFAGRRVIQQTLGLGKKLPDDFQTAEFALDHGLVDLIVPGNLLKGSLTEIFELYAAAPLKKRRPKVPVH